jgi:membrane protease YdiL (CAAX protease family)
MGGRKAGRRLPGTVAVFFGWVAVTVATGRLSMGDAASLDALVTGGLVWGVAAAAGFLVAVIALTGWSDLGFRRPVVRWLPLFWLPTLYLPAFLALALAKGLPEPRVIGLIAVNCLLVGLIFTALRTRLRIWPAVWLTTILFGSMHVLNVALTGQAMAAVAQAVAATLTGLVLMAILLRSGSLWAAILYHGLWNLTAFLVAHDPTRTAGAVTPEPWMLWVPVAFLVPNGLYGLWLLRGIGRTPPPGDFAEGRR